MLGRSVAHYRITELLGGGGMGVVYAAEDARLGRRVALKFLPPAVARDPLAIERFHREARAASALNHPHICTIHDVGETSDGPDAGQHYIVMELLEGQTLKRLIADGPLPVDRIVQLGGQIADALDAAHARGIIHRDIKPANIFVTTRGDAKVLDFGLAKLQPHADGDAQGPQLDDPTVAVTRTAPDLVTGHGVAIGTIAYMSPEQARGDELDPRTDLFSLGVVLYEMATGRQPFSGRTSAVVFDAILNRHAEPVTRLNPSIPFELARTIQRCLEKDRAMRYQTAADLRSGLHGVTRKADSGRRGNTKPALSAPVDGALSVVEHVDARTRDFPSRSRGTRPSGQRTRYLFLLAPVILAAIWGLRWFFDRPARVDATGAGGRPALAVMPFVSAAADADNAWLARGIPNMVTTGLAQTEGLDVVSTERVDEILGDARSPQGLTGARLLAAGRRAGAGAIVTGTIYKLGDEFRIDATVQGVDSGQVTAAHTVRGTDVFTLVDDLTTRIRGSVNAADPAPADSIAEVTSGSLDAYKLYLEGLDARINLRYLDARRAFEEAVRIDPSFASAYLQLRIVSESLRRPDDVKKYRALTTLHRRRLPERDRLLIEAEEARDAGEWQRGLQVLEQLARKYPGDENPYFLIARSHAQRGDSDRAMATLTRGVAAVPRSAALHNSLGYALVAAGRYPEAIREFQTYADLEPDEANPHDSLGEAHLVAGQPEEALAAYGRALQVDARFANAHLGRAWAFGMLGRYAEALDELERFRKAVVSQGVESDLLELAPAYVLSRSGRYREADVRITAGLAAARREKDVIIEVAFLVLRFGIALERGDPRRALEVAREAEAAARDGWNPARSGSRVGLAALVAVASVAAGRIDLASEQFDRLPPPQADSAPDEQWYRGALRGEIQLARGEFAAAAATFAQAEPRLKMPFAVANPALAIFANGFSFRDGLARAKTAGGDTAGAIAEYQKLLALGVGQKWTAMREPRFVLRLARLLDESGDRVGAAREYARFLELWRNADAGLPEIAEARAKAAMRRAS